MQMISYEFFLKKKGFILNKILELLTRTNNISEFRLKTSTTDLHVKNKISQ